MKPKFTTPCFISKNTPELRKKLEELGYKRSSTFDDNQKFIWTTETHYYSTNNDMLGCSYGEKVLPYGIYCGENEQLFIAIAALREDSDKFQWFCDDEDVENKSMFFCKYDDVEKHIHNEMDGWDCEGFHKATPDELIAYFHSHPQP